MKKSGRDNRPYVKPVKRIELSEQNMKLRWIFVVVLLTIGVSAIGVGISDALRTEPGWQPVEVMSDQPHYGEDFVLMYDFGETSAGAKTLEKALVGIYTASMEHAYRVFHPSLQAEGLCNVAYLNAHVNETVAVDPVLYRALSVAKRYENRHLFMAPCAAEYSGIFLCDNDMDAVWFDPSENADMASWLQTLARYAADPEQIDLQILENNQVRLVVSEAYLTFAREHEISTFLDFDWMCNAFIIDYVAEELTSQGFTKGYLSSFDGFTRNLDARGNDYSFNIFDRQGNEINKPALFQYSEPMSIVFLRNFAMSTSDRWHYYTFATGNAVMAYLDPQDGRSKSAVPNLVSYSAAQSCAEILMQTADVFIADEFVASDLQRLAAEGVYSIWFQDLVLQYNDPALNLEMTEGSSAVPYTPQLVN